jgi:hypothetical protein
MPTPTYTLIDSVTLTSSASSVTFSSISAAGKGDLVLVADCFTPSGTANLRLNFNSDSGNNWEIVRLFSLSNSPDSDVFSAASQGIISRGSLATSKALFSIQAFDFASTDKHKTYLVRGGDPSQNVLSAIAGRWASTAAVTSMSFYSTSGTFATGSTFNLFQIVSE